MNLRKYTKHAIFFASVLSMAALFSRCSAGSSTPAGSATTYSISGNLAVGQTALSVASMKAQMSEVVATDVNALATQCSDNFYYTVYCVSYSEPPVSATGAVTCGGANSGAFTVAGLPLNAEIGCFVRRSSDNVTYSTLGTIEIPTTSLTGGTTSIVSQGDLQLAINLNTDGSITTAVSSGANNVSAPATAGSSVDAAAYSGFWLLACDPAATDTLVNPVKCKCQNGGQQKTQYNQTNGSLNPNHLNPEEACFADNASVVTTADTQQYIELNMYKATPAAPLMVDNGSTIPTGTQVPVISVWSASNGTTSSRGAGGEGAGTSVKDKNGATVNLTWSSAQATNPIAWTTTGNPVSLANGISVNLTAANGSQAMPTASATAGTWKAWVAALYNNSTGFTCNWGNNASGASDAGCLAEFSERALRENRSVNLPVVRIERKCGNGGCDASVANAYVFVDGYKANYSGVANGTSADAVSLTSDGITTQVRNRFVFEPFEVSPTGGGFTQHEYYNNNFGCSNSGATAGICTGTQNFVNCGIRAETAIHFKTINATNMKIFFEERSNVTYAVLEKWTGGIKTQGTFAEAMTACNAQVSSREGRFQMTAVKQ